MSDRVDPRPLGFDAAVTFAPDWRRLGPAVRASAGWRAFRKAFSQQSAYRTHRLRDYRSVVEQALGSPRAPYTTHPCVCPGFDNTPRRPGGGATVLLGSSPSLYEWWVREVCSSMTPRDGDDDLLFVNAWNEWGEGNHLEPCQRWGRGYLEAHERAINEASQWKGSIATRLRFSGAIVGGQMVAELLFLSPHLPHRRIAHAGGQFSWAWLSALSACSRVHLVTPATLENASAPRDLPPCVRVTMVPMGPPPHPLAARLHDARTGGITPGLASLAAFRSSPAFADAVASADLVEIHWQHLLPLANDVRKMKAEVPITAFVHDVMTQKARREAKSARHFRTRIASTVRAYRAQAVEPRLLAGVDQIFTFTHKDRDLLRGMGVTRPVEVVDPNVQVPKGPTSGSERPVVAFTGAMSRSTNSESIAWFLAGCGRGCCPTWLVPP